jgi:hypothetical protein
MRTRQKWKGLIGEIMKKLIWKIRFCYYFCARIKDPTPWNWYWVGGAVLENNPDNIDEHPSDAVDEELSYWGD